MTIDLVPLKHFSQRICEGWTMCPGYELKAGDYAVTMQSPGHDAIQGTKARASTSRNLARTRPSKGEGKAL